MMTLHQALREIIAISRDAHLENRIERMTEIAEQALEEKMSETTESKLGSSELLGPRCDGHKLDNDRQVFFYEQDFYVLSNFSAFQLKWVGIEFDTSEHAYHFLKFRPQFDEGTNEQRKLRGEIMYARSAHDAFKLAETNKHLRRPDWDTVKVGIMRELLRAKADQHEYVRRKLLATGDRELIEDSCRDSFWGWGPNRDGKNMLGKLWMEVRTELRAASPAMSEQKRRDGHSKLVYDKATRTVKTVDPHPARPDREAVAWRKLADEITRAIELHRSSAPHDLRRTHAHLADLLFGHIGVVITALRASPPASAVAPQDNLREAWSALSMIREAVETLAPSGAVKAAEHLDGPTFAHEAETLIAGIMAITSPASADVRIGEAVATAAKWESRYNEL
jgi:ribA/ribD-fused uncharacterized protein